MMRLTLSVPAELLERLEQARGRRSRSSFACELLERGLRDDATDVVAAVEEPRPATHEEALLLLAESARSGRSVQARIALERALRDAEPPPVEPAGWFDGLRALR